jgi:hypothetical protein
MNLLKKFDEKLQSFIQYSLFEIIQKLFSSFASDSKLALKEQAYHQGSQAKYDPGIII